MIKAVLFDLDDTLFDHQYSRRCGLLALKSSYSVLDKIALETLEATHEEFLTATYKEVLQGSISPEDATIERIRLLCARYGLYLKPEEAIVATDCYRLVYHQNRRAIPGIKQLFQALSGKVKIGVVTNGLVAVQNEKIQVCGLTGITTLVISEEVGVKKPDKRIFDIALRQVDAVTKEVVFVGDSWTTDIMGAYECGIRSVWLNRYNASYPKANLGPNEYPNMITEIASYEPIEETLKILLGDD